MTRASAILAHDVPASLIYEWDDGQPIYYRGYQEVLMGKKTAEEIMGDSTLQAWIKSKLYLFQLLIKLYKYGALCAPPEYCFSCRSNKFKLNIRR